MISTFHCGESGQRLSVLDYDESRTNNVRYRAVINDDQVAVLHLQTVDTEEDTPDVSQLSLCPGVLESEVLHLLSQSPVSNSLVCVMFLIEKLHTGIVYRSRSCPLLYDNKLKGGGVCLACAELINNLKQEFFTEFKNEASNSPEEGKAAYDEKDEFECENVAVPDDIYDSDAGAEFDNDGEDELSDSASDPNYEPTNTDREAVKPTVINILKKEKSDEDSEVSPPRKRKRKGESRQQFLCEHCEYQTVYISNLKQHIASIHEGTRYPCSQCDYKAVAPASLRIHIQKIHAGIKYYCDQCDAVFNLKGTLRMHIRTVHEGLSFHCQHCDYQASQKSHITVHTNAKHSSQVMHICDKCDYQGTTLANLKHHLRAKHSNIKFPCDRCEYQATSKGNLRKHVEAMHLSIKYPCDQCEYQATHKCHLQAHIRFKHEGITFPCDHCSFQASTSNNLKQHVKRKHKDD